MVGALVYLRLRSLQNWVLWRARRLRRPKYLVGTLVALAYFYVFVFRAAGNGGRARHVADLAGSMPHMADVAMAIGTLAVLVVLAAGWIIPTKRASLGFSEAEIAFLFPAPVSRKALVHFRLISAQIRSLVAGAVLALLSNRWTFFGGNPLTHVLGWWLIFAAMNLHFTGASFTLTRLADRGVSVTARRILVVACLAVPAVWTAWRLEFPADGGLAQRLVGLTGAAPLCWLVYPLRWVIAPFLAPDWAAFGAAVWPAVLLLGVQYYWVTRAVVAFEEASISRAERRGARIAAWRSGERHTAFSAGGRTPPFALAGAGRPEVAFLWKNLLSTWPYFNLRVFGAAAALIAAASLVPRVQARWATPAANVAWIALVVSIYILVIGGQFARQDIRSDIRKLDILKTYPLAGWQVVVGELLTPALILAGLVWLALLAFVLNVQIPETSWLNPSLRLGALASASMLVPPLVLLQLLIPNAAALIFPGWFEATRARGGGPEVMGQRMIFFFAQLVTLLVLLLPAAAMGALVAWLAHFVVGVPAGIVLATVPVAAVLLGEAALGIAWLGGRFERIDVADELRT